MIAYLYYTYTFQAAWNVEVALSIVVFYGTGNLFIKFAESKVDSGSLAKLTF